VPAETFHGCPVAHGVGWLGQPFLADPYPELARLRDESPVWYDPDLDHYVVTRYADIEQMLLDRATFRASNASSPIWEPAEPARRILQEQGYKRVPTLNNADPPRHAPMRKAVFTCMSPRRLRALEPEVRRYTTGLVERLVVHPVADLVADLARPLPAHTGLGLLGFPDEAAEQIKEWSDRRVLFTYGRLPADEQVLVASNIVAFWRFCEEYVAERDANRRDDFTSDLLAYRDEHPDLVTTDDTVNIVYSMALAGHDSTTNALANAFRHLLAHHEQWEALCKQPDLIPNAVEEALRFDGPVMGQRRMASVDTEVGGVAVPAGAKLVALLASGAHDRAHFTSPDTLDVCRRNADEHLAFGKGVHFCLGAPLARMELRVALEITISLASGMRLAPEQTFAYSPNVLFRALQELWVHPRPASEAVGTDG
jgi:cytochrome P450